MIQHHGARCEVIVHRLSVYSKAVVSWRACFDEKDAKRERTTSFK